MALMVQWEDTGFGNCCSRQAALRSPAAGSAVDHQAQLLGVPSLH